jgi:hypothetical protein
MILVDEAGGLCLSSLRGLVLLSDSAGNLLHRLSIVLIGMDDLPRALNALPQIKGRLNEFCYFEPYGENECWQFLTKLHPHFSEERRDDPVLQEHVRYVFEATDGLPGRMAAFCTRLRGLVSARGDEVTLEALRMVRMITDTDTARAQALLTTRTASNAELALSNAAGRAKRIGSRRGRRPMLKRGSDTDAK